MNPYASHSSRLTGSLGLEVPPIALARVDEVPEGVAPLGDKAPAGCAFWTLARTRVFFTEADDHAGCPIGTLTMGLEPSDEVNAEVGVLVEQMESLGYLSPGEAASLPMIPTRANYVIYGALDQFPVTADALLLTVNPEQAMVLAEAVHGVDMGAPTLRVLGRPACSAIPTALASSEVTMSLGCAGMRTFTALEPGMLLAVIPGGEIDETVDRVEKLSSSNAAMRAFYEERLAASK